VRLALAEEAAHPGGPRSAAQTRHLLGTHTVVRRSVAPPRGA